MPTSDHVVPQRLRSGKQEVGSGSMAKKAQTVHGRRVGIPIADDEAKGILSPFLTHLPPFSGVQAIRDYLPASPSKAPLSVHRSHVPTGVWQIADLQDGHGRRPLLLVWSERHALQIFAQPSGTIPEDSSVPEIFPPPEEVFSLARIPQDPGATSSSSARGGQDTVASATLLDKGPLWEKHGPVVALSVIGPTTSRRDLPNISIVIVSLRTGVVIHRAQVGNGDAVNLAASPRAIIVGVPRPSPTLHILDPSSLSPLHPPIVDLPCNPSTHLPIFSLAQRILAYATTSQPRNHPSDGLGSLVTAKYHPQRPRTSTSDGALDRTAEGQSSKSDLQTVVFNSAYEIGGAVGRGVWKGLKMGAKAAQAANKARSGKLGTSAPVESLEARGEDDDAVPPILDDDAESTGSIEEDKLGRANVTQASIKRGEWVKVIDLYPRPPTSDAQKPQSVVEPEIIAHFRLPVSRSSNFESRSRARSDPANSLSQISFSPQGTHFVVCPEDGRTSHVFELHPAGLRRNEVIGEVKGSVWHLYELRRGNTAGRICEVGWEMTGRWVGLATAKGTIHVFPINLSGGPPDARSHASLFPVNPARLYPLSTPVNSALRFKPRRAQSEGDAPIPYGPGVFTFAQARTHAKNGKILQDIAAFRPDLAQVEVARLSIAKVKNRTTNATEGQEPSSSGPVTSKPSGGLREQLNRQTSGLTEVMRAKAWSEASDLGVTGSVKARWLMPLRPGDDDEDVLVPKAKLQRDYPGPPVSSLARAEILTFNASSRMLPASIYLSPQIVFYAARAIDEYNPLSILDSEARTRRLIFRHEVQPQSASPSSPLNTAGSSPLSPLDSVESFEEPLLTALHSIIESPPDTQVPGLPNGYPGGARWPNIPIKHVAQGFEQGVGMVKREYVRVQQGRMRRRESQEASRLSFDDDVVLPDHEEDAFINEKLEKGLSLSPTSPPLIAPANASPPPRAFAFGTSPPGGPTSNVDRGSPLKQEITNKGIPAQSVESHMLDKGDIDSGPSSFVPRTATNSDSSNEAESSEPLPADDEEWAERWEEEYARAVEEDGGPEELMLGLMDEEQEERRKWVEKREEMKRQWSGGT